MANIPTVAHNEATPAGTDYVREGDDRIRELKTQFREVIAVDHKMDSAGQGATWGMHKWITFIEAADIGTGAEGLPILGAQTVGGKAELLFTDEDDNDVQLTTAGKLKAGAGMVVQVVNVMDGAVSTGSAPTPLMPLDDTIPQNDEGDEFMTLAITPKSATNKLKIEVVWYGTSTSSTSLGAALFQDATANALAAAHIYSQFNGNMQLISFTHYMAAGTTDETTFKVRVGHNTEQTLTFNGAASARLLGGVCASSITITEIVV